MLGPIVIDDVRPRTLVSDHPAKAVVDHRVRVSAAIFRDGHDVLAARICWRPAGEAPWRTAPLRLVNDGLDRWEGTFTPGQPGLHEFVVEGWTDRWATWTRDTVLKADAGQEVEVELLEGARLLERLAGLVAPADNPLLVDRAASLRRRKAAASERLAAALDPAVVAALDGVPDRLDATESVPFALWVDRERAAVGAWYELFPRSEGGLRRAGERRLPQIAAMGFDVVYLPPIHPIGTTHRKGRGNTLVAAPGDPGSPWAIGSREGGHTAVAPDLGTLDDVDWFVAEADRLGLEVALDYALQCSPDHPWVTEHPEWFHRRPDGSIRYAENPPKRYQDIYPLNVWPEDERDRLALWHEAKAVLDFWIGHGVRIFRVDNPHTKPLAFWEWLIPAVQAEERDAVFLAEAFTRPPMMAKLAEVGFSQSYTYFTWRTTNAELREYVTELAYGPTADYLRPTFWANTPDILSGPLRNGSAAAFRLRYVLAATLVPACGIYSGYELCENEPASDDNEEYLHSEKYELVSRDWSRPDSIAPFITAVNQIRRGHPAFTELANITFHHADNDALLVYSKRSPDDVMLMVVNLDPARTQAGTLTLELESLGLSWDGQFVARDELSGARWVWRGQPWVRLDPALHPAHLISIEP